MLEKLMSGQRSGTRPFRVFVVSQNHSNVRRSSVSRKGSDRGACGPTAWLHARSSTHAASQNRLERERQVSRVKSQLPTYLVSAWSRRQLASYRPQGIGG